MKQVRFAPAQYLTDKQKKRLFRLAPKLRQATTDTESIRLQHEYQCLIDAAYLNYRRSEHKQEGVSDVDKPWNEAKAHLFKLMIDVENLEWYPECGSILMNQMEKMQELEGTDWRTFTSSLPDDIRHHPLLSFLWEGR